MSITAIFAVYFTLHKYAAKIQICPPDCFLHMATFMSLATPQTK